MEISSYAQAEFYLLGMIGEVASPRSSYKLDRIRALLAELGDPHRAYPTLHVGGTSGKGSTTTMIAGALQASGRRTGLHTKPHISSMTERARIDGTPISTEHFARLLNEMLPAIERVAQRHGPPTYYETLLALSFAHFAAEHVDVAVIEVGLGGRLDGTNVIIPEVAAITSVGFDHTDVLGDTIEAIAFEKAGIAKTGVPLVVAAVPAAAQLVIERCAADAGATVVRVRDVVRVDVHDDRTMTVTGMLSTYVLQLPVLGAFQRVNAATAIAALEQLRDELRPDRGAIERGLAQVAIPGRMELFSAHPQLIFDIAHNVEKARALVASLTETFPARRIHYVVAINDTKDARQMLAIFAGIPSTFTFTSFSSAGRHAILPQRLAMLAESLGAWGRAIDDPVEALTVARRLASPDDVVVVTGSTFIVSTLRAWYTSAAVC